MYWYEIVTIIFSILLTIGAGYLIYCILFVKHIKENFEYTKITKEYKNNLKECRYWSNDNPYKTYTK